MRDLQERAARALPAEHVKDVDGWWLRHAPGSSWWVGTVQPHGDASGDGLRHRVRKAEEFYAGYGDVARFQISPGACPDGLDGLLAERGYLRQRTVSLRAASTARVLEQAPAPSPRVRVDDRPTLPWLDTWQAVHGGDSRAEWDMFTRLQLPAAYACAVSGDGVVAVGRAVADTGWAGVFGMATLPRARGTGAARAVLAALAEWSRAHAADHMYLQVERDNAPALRLYARMGFGEVCGYHYRTPT